MVKVNYHIHTIGSDGDRSPRQVIEHAIQKGIKFICFTDHYTLPLKEFYEFLHKLPKRTSHEDKYYEEIMKLKEEFKDKIDISFGMEFDFFDKFKDFTKKEITKRDYDFIIGSIHILPVNDKFFLIPWSVQEWHDFVKIIGDDERIIRLYYQELLKLVKSRFYDCVGHLDAIKNYCPQDWKKIEKQKWYRDIIFEILDEIKKAGMCIEINTSGLKRTIKEQYPSEWILVEARKRGIPITIGTDSHLETDDAYLDDGIEMAKKAGYKKVAVFNKRIIKEVEL